QDVVEHQARRELEEADGPVAVYGGDELLRAYEMWRQRSEPFALAHGLEHQPHVALLEVAEPTVDELRGAARGPAGEIAALDQRGSEPAHRRVTRDAGPVDAAADDEQVEGL